MSTGHDHDLLLEEAEPEPEGLDHRIAHLLDDFGQSTSRRGFIARIGRFLVAVMGGTAIAVLPMDPIASEADAVICPGAMHCGMCGRKCCGSPCGGGVSGCPPGTSLGGYWTRCCGGTRYRYRDCCGGSVNCNHCTFCDNGCNQPAWCDGLGPYRCTVIASLGTSGCPL